MLIHFCLFLLSSLAAYFIFVVGKTEFSSDEDAHVVGDCVKVKCCLDK